jgi:hypothetical protein
MYEDGTPGESVHHHGQGRLDHFSGLMDSFATASATRCNTACR